MISTGSDKDNDTITDQDSNVLTDNGGKEVTNGNIKHALMDLGAFLSVRKFGERVFNGQAHHMLSRFLNLRIYDFLSLVFLRGRSFRSRSNCLTLCCPLKNET